MPGRIVWCQCGKNSIPAPEGATEKTRYVCPSCSPLGVAEGAEFDRCQFDHAEIASGVSRRELFGFLAANLDEMLRRASPRLTEAFRRGEMWALTVTRSRLLALSDNQRHAMLMYYWGGLEQKEIAEILGVSIPAVKMLLCRAQRRLVT